MRRSKLFLLLFLLFSVFVSSSCSCFGFQEDEEEKIEFSIEASSTTYYLGDGYITIRPTNDSVFDTEYNYNKRIEYFIVGEDNVESTLKNSGDTGLFIANKRGSIKIQAKYKDVLSTNVIEIVCDFRNEDVSGSIENILNKNLVLGASYYIGLDSDLGISLSGGEGIIELNEDCELEVIGVGAGTITIKKNNDVLYEGPYNIERSENILLVLNDLLENNHISSLQDNVVNSKFSLVEEVDFSDTSSDYVYFLKYLPNLKKINISNHNVSYTNIEWLKELTELEELYLLIIQILLVLILKI